jgi:hypothetical protein
VGCQASLENVEQIHGIILGVSIIEVQILPKLLVSSQAFPGFGSEAV